MKASLDNPIYTVALYTADGTKYDLTSVLLDIDFSDQNGQLAQSATVTIANCYTGGNWLSNIIRVRQRVYIFANDGQKNDEVFRGYVWTQYPIESTDGKEITMKCYDHLIYLQESEASYYFSKGKKTSAVVGQICTNWRITYKYNYSSITHDKLVLRGPISDMFISDLLDKVKERYGTKYVIRSQKDVVYFMPVGSNTTVYDITSKNNAVQTRSEQTMDGVITKVRILGKADKNDQVPIVATVTGNTSQYGTLQKLQDKDEDTSLADAKAEANTTIKEHGKPKWEYEVQAPDIPWIRKGDKVNVNAGTLRGSYIVISIDRSISNKGKKMTLTLENLSVATTTSTASSSKKSNTEIAREVINGKWGNGTTRKNKLTAAGYDYAAVQKEVNAILKGRK